MNDDDIYKIKKKLLDNVAKRIDIEFNNAIRDLGAVNNIKANAIILDVICTMTDYMFSTYFDSLSSSASITLEQDNMAKKIIASRSLDIIKSNLIEYIDNITPTNQTVN